MTPEQVGAFLEASAELGVKEYYLTGGEPFMNPQILNILEMTLAHGPVSILTNGTLLKPAAVEQMAHLEQASIYSLEIRISMEGYDAQMNDAIRGRGVFQKAMDGMRLLVQHGFLPIITATKTWEESRDQAVWEGFQNTLRSHGYERPRLKILPSLKIGREAVRDRGYDRYQRVTAEMMAGYDVSQLVCSNTRVATDRGVYVCPILLDNPIAFMGKTLKEATGEFELRHQPCFTCYLYGAVCSNISSVSQNG
jgi:molybdenum cofactor biosynthesis enzyme MoaA